MSLVERIMPGIAGYRPDESASKPPLNSTFKKVNQTSIEKLQYYLPFNEGTKANVFQYVYYEGINAVSVSLRYIVNKIVLLFAKCINSEQAEGGFHKESFDLWNPSTESLGINGQEGKLKLTPYELAQALGFNKAPEEVEAELDQVPTRVKGGYILKGEEEGNVARFRRQLGLEKSQQLLSPTTPFSVALSLDAGVSQGYSVGTHSMMVVRMFDEHLTDRFTKKDNETKLAKFGDIVTIDEFRLFLMLHDIGKGLAVNEEGQFETPERKRKELKYCKDAIDRIVEKKVIDVSKGNLFKALLEDITIGKLLKGKINVEVASEEIKQAMKKNDLKIGFKQFFNLCKLFHIADAGAYKNLRSIRGLFEEEIKTKKVRHAKTQGDPEKNASRKLKALKNSMVEADSEVLKNPLNDEI